jgi:hypothetical protein
MVGFGTRNVPKKLKERHLYAPCGPLPLAIPTSTVGSQGDSKASRGNNNANFLR